MNTIEAKKIVGYCIEWQFVLMGIKTRSELDSSVKIDIKNYSLEDLIKANKLVESDNKKREKLAEYHRKEGHKVKGISIKMTLADRLIAAIYTATHFTPSSEGVAIIDDVVVGCVRAKY